MIETETASDPLVEVEHTEESRRRAASALPEPAGYKILIALPEPERMTEGGLYKPDQALDVERITTVVGIALRLGPDAYKDASKFPSGPYCKEGDWVIFRAYSGTRMKIYGKEFRFINDDQVEAVVEDPQGIERA